MEGHRDGLILGVEAVDAAELGGDDVAHLVVVVALEAHAVVVEAEVGVGVDEAGVDGAAGEVDDLLSGGGLEALADGGDLAVLDGDVGLVGLGVHGVVDDSVFQKHGLTSCSFRMALLYKILRANTRGFRKFTKGEHIYPWNSLSILFVCPGEFRASGREFLCPRRQRNQNAAEPTVRTPFFCPLRRLIL